DTDNEWLELYNNDTTDIDITGWRFYEAGINHSLTLIQGSRIIPAGGYAIIADNATTFLDEHQECNCTVIDSAFSLNNSGEYIALKNATLGIIDEVAYNASWGADGNGRTLELNATGRWEESRVDEGTSCQQNSLLAVDYSGE
ncbi:MAG: lamin tail domain-containing protein, partial [Methanophagales archaeon]|nr:lamin tail domain-containing protein [Methanophagales archaeon]